jgi:hypothetical protein
MKRTTTNILPEHRQAVIAALDQLLAQRKPRPGHGCHGHRRKPTGSKQRNT